MSWAGTYHWHDGHSSHHRRSPGQGVLVRADYFAGSLHKDEGPDLTGGQAVAHNEQSAAVGSSKAYGRFAAPYGTVAPGSKTNLKFYPLRPEHVAGADAQVAHHGFTHYYAGPGHAKPDLANKNYNTGHLMIYAPEAGSGSDFGETSYTDAWRKQHELAHALVYPELNAKYGEGRRIGGLGRQRSLREAKRAVEWEWMAAHKQRDLAAQLGVRIPDEDFHRELNTVMHDAVHRAVTGKFTDPSEEGFQPHPHKVPLETALSMVDEAGKQMGLRDEHETLKKSSPKGRFGLDNTNLSTTGATIPMADEKLTKNMIRDALVVSLKKMERVIVATEARERAGTAKLSKNAAGDLSGNTGDGLSVPAGTGVSAVQKGALPEVGGHDGGQGDQGQAMKMGEKAPEGKEVCPSCHTRVGIDKEGGTKPHTCKGGERERRDQKANFHKDEKVAQVNKELQGFKSLASNPTAMPGNVKPKPVAKNATEGYAPQMAAQTASAATSAPMGKNCGSEMKKDEGDGDGPCPPCPKCNGPKTELVGTYGGKTHYLCKGCGEDFSAGADPRGTAASDAPMGKSDDDGVDATDQAPDKKVKGAKLPDGAPEAIKTDGSGKVVRHKLGKNEYCMHKADVSCPHCKGTGKKPPASDGEIRQLSRMNEHSRESADFRASHSAQVGALEDGHQASPYGATHSLSHARSLGYDNMSPDELMMEPNSGSSHEYFRHQAGKTYHGVGTDEDASAHADSNYESDYNNPPMYDETEVGAEHPAHQHLAALMAASIAARGTKADIPPGKFPVQMGLPNVKGEKPMGKADTWSPDSSFSGKGFRVSVGQDDKKKRKSAVGIRGVAVEQTLNPGHPGAVPVAKMAKDEVPAAAKAGRPSVMQRLGSGGRKPLPGGKMPLPGLTPSLPGGVGVAAPKIPPGTHPDTQASLSGLPHKAAPAPLAALKAAVGATPPPIPAAAAKPTVMAKLKGQSHSGAPPLPVTKAEGKLPDGSGFFTGTVETKKAEDKDGRKFWDKKNDGKDVGHFAPDPQKLGKAGMPMAPKAPGMHDSKSTPNPMAAQGGSAPASAKTPKAPSVPKVK